MDQDTSLWNTLVVYDAKFCLKYMIRLLEGKLLTPSERDEIARDSKILSRGMLNYEYVLKKWILRSLTEEIEDLEKRIAEEGRSS